MTSARLAIVATICLTSMHNTQIVDELDVALLAVKPGTKAFCKLLYSVHGMQLLGRNTRHMRVAVDQRRTQQRSLDKLAYRFSIREEERRSILEIWVLVPSLMSANSTVEVQSE
jgi:hypothetical protein